METSGEGVVRACVCGGGLPGGVAAASRRRGWCGGFAVTGRRPQGQGRQREIAGQGRQTAGVGTQRAQAQAAGVSRDSRDARRDLP